MEQLLVLTALAKQHKMDKYLQWAMRKWFLYEIVEFCTLVHMKGRYFDPRCPRCNWLASVEISTTPPARAVRKFLRLWYKR